MEIFLLIKYIDANIESALNAIKHALLKKRGNIANELRLTCKKMKLPSTNISF